MLPFTPEHMLRTVSILSAVGLIATILAMTRTFKLLFPVWAALVFYWLFRDFFSVLIHFRMLPLSKMRFG